ncbi:MAG TPA: hypothetical protein VG095_02135 [Chthoniobacterales bacterium]|nr:hypothetical protein [Chthoniobacterales bacterium]
MLHDRLPDSYEISKVLLAKAGFDGTLQLLTSAWERLLGYGRKEFNAKTLVHLMWSNRRNGATAASAILNHLDMAPIDLRLRCRSGLGKSLRPHRLYDRQEGMMYIVAEEIADEARPRSTERRTAVRPCLVR